MEGMGGGEGAWLALVELWWKGFKHLYNLLLQFTGSSLPVEHVRLLSVSVLSTILPAYSYNRQL